MKKIESIFLFIIIGTIGIAKISFAACPSYLKNYPEDCEILTQYQTLKEEFMKHGVNIEEIAEYRAPRLINREDLKSTIGEDGIEKLEVHKIYQPSSKTWNYWEKGNFFRQNLSHQLLAQFKEKGKWTLTVEDLKKMHRQTIDEELVGYLQSFFYLVPGFEKICPKPGDLKTTVCSYFSGFHATLDEDQIRVIENYPLKDSQGKPLIQVTKKKQSNGRYKVFIYYYPSKNIESELSRLVEEINVKMNRYLKNEDPGESPLSFSSKVQKTYVSLHPFHEANGRMSRLIQDLIVDTLGFPYVPSGDLQNDVTITKKSYRKNTKKFIRKTLARLTDCLRQYESGKSHVSVACKSVYDTYPKEYVANAILKNQCFSKIPEVESLELERLEKWVGHELSAPRSLTSQEKDSIIEKLATPLEKDLVTYSWSQDSNWNSLNLNDWLSYTKQILPQMLVNRIPNSNNQIMGDGTYSSEDLGNSSIFSWSKEARNELRKFFQSSKDQLAQNPAKSHPLAKELESLLKQDRFRPGVLKRLTIRKGASLLDFTNIEVKQKLALAGIEEKDLINTQANVTIRYGGPENTWVNTKIRDPHLVTLEKLDYKNLTIEEKNKLLTIDELHQSTSIPDTWDKVLTLGALMYKKQFDKQAN